MLQPLRTDRSLSAQATSDCILVVDDSPDNLFLVQTILEEEGYQLAFAVDGLTALEKIRQSPPSLVLLDVMMPGMNGYEVTQKIRSNPNLPFIPILLVTAHEESSVVKGLDTGADDFIRKPFDMDELLARVRALLRLKHSIDAEQEIMRQREDFVSRLTHDLRTPLVAADRMLTLLKKETFGAVAPTAQEAIAGIIRSNQNLLQMVNTLLEVYRYEAGKKTMTFARFDFEELIRDVGEELRPLAEEKGLSFELIEVTKATDWDGKIMGDCLEIRRVITNLIGNAIKFTDDGFIQIKIKLENPDSNRQDSPYVCAIIQDTGTGIAAEDQQEIFEWFRQGNHMRAGSGLGLHLSHRIVTAHQGRIEVESELSKGSTFRLYLPVNANVTGA
ncbi:MAG: hybrid sensor histidine kinase/response regulator [Leptolyngbyaceae cyanobacterium SL_1_1]|nr:hybrid sensor histidine kinase/response regulator [Leptolyngbyaceae cyanobacterium RM1_1_2]NJO10045.1 hybrid sensor histidine kinase/response regulator [Leptolyngbyaceae cyanobacterium SL_1_1]